MIDKAARRATRREQSQAKRMGEVEARTLTSARVPRNEWARDAAGKPTRCVRCYGKHEGFHCKPVDIKPNRKRY